MGFCPMVKAKEKKPTSVIPKAGAKMKIGICPEIVFTNDQEN